MNEAEVLIEYAKAWNNLDVSGLEGIISEDLQYRSQWVFDTMYGRETYLDYMRGKFRVIKNEIVNAHLTAEIGYFKYTYGENNKPCIILTQHLQQSENKTILLIKVKNGRISEIDMCGVPDLRWAIQLDLFPD